MVLLLHCLYHLVSNQITGACGEGDFQTGNYFFMRGSQKTILFDLKKMMI